MRSPALLAVVLFVAAAGCVAPAGPTDTPAAPTAGNQSAPPDPATDRLGWEDGYWHNESLALTRDDGLNASERRAVVGRSMARVERIRRLEFEQRVPVDVVSREEYRERYAGGGGNHSTAFRRFDNAKFEAMFLIGEDTDSLATQSSNRGANVLGFYSPSNDSIVLVSEGETPTIGGELTLGHELVHALQDQHFDLGSVDRPTRDAYNAVNGVIEGDASYVENRYAERCGRGWSCLSPPEGGGGGGGGDLHYGVYFLNFFPYSDGPGLISHYREQGGWPEVNAMYRAPPRSAEQVIHPKKYMSDPPTEVSLADRSGPRWQRVRPESRLDYATLGQSALSATFAYTFTDDYNGTAVVTSEQFINRGPEGRVDSEDPFNYALEYTDGWDGDRLYVYQKADESAYVWKIDWDSPAEARQFARGYRKLLSHWGGERVADGVWVVDEGPYADAFRLSVSGDSVVITNAPERGDLSAVR